MEHASEPGRRPASTAGPSAAVRLSDVRRVYGEGTTAVHALAGVTVDFAASTFTAIMGPSGSGKTTLLQIAAGLAVPTAGEVFFGGTELVGMRESELAVLRRRRMGFVFQQFNLLPALTARENIGLPSRLGGQQVDDDWVRTVLERTDMREHVDRYPHELSGGQQQRTAICRALATRPEVIFADEPTGALDTRTGEGILALLRAAVDEFDQTVVMVTHEPAAAAYADRVLFLRDGSLIDHVDGPTVQSITAQLAVLDRG